MRRAAGAPDLVLRYDVGDENVIDVRFPVAGEAAGNGSAPAPAPVVVILHGGFWKPEFDRVHTRSMADALVGAGYVVVMPEYRRVRQPGGGWPGTFEDVAMALDMLPSLMTAAAPDRTDLTRPVLVGHSAGGQLALWSAARSIARREAGALPVGGVVALAPVADLATAARIDLDEGAVQDVLGGEPGEVPERYAFADPTVLVPIGVRIAVLHGDADPYVPLEQSTAFVAAASAAGDDVQLTVLPGEDHFALIDPLSTAWPQVLATIRAFA